VEKNTQPLAEVFGHPTTDFSERARRYRKEKLCPFNNEETRRGNRMAGLWLVPEHRWAEQPDKLQPEAPPDCLHQIQEFPGHDYRFPGRRCGKIHKPTSERSGQKTGVAARQQDHRKPFAGQL